MLPVLTFSASHHHSPLPRLRVVVSTSQPGVFVMTAYQALIRPSGEDAMGRSCTLDSHPGRWMPAAMRMPAAPRNDYHMEFGITASLIHSVQGRALPPVRWLFDLYCARVLRAGRIQRTSQTTCFAHPLCCSCTVPQNLKVLRTLVHSVPSLVPWVCYGHSLSQPSLKK
jgi:hypothetical protein